MPAIHFKGKDLPFVTAKTENGDTRIARVLNAGISHHLGAGLEVVERVSIRWTVTFDEVLFIHDGNLTIETDHRRFECKPGDIVWLPSGTTLTYDASKGRCAYFYALYPVDWAARQGTKEP